MLNFSSADDTDNADSIFSLCDDKDWGEPPLKNPCYLRHLRMKNLIA